VNRMASMARLHPVVLTRPEGRNEVLADYLQAQGCPTLILPALTIAALLGCAETLPLPDDYDLVIFVSGTAVRAYAEQLQRMARRQQWPSTVPVASVGPATAAAMRGDFWPAALRVLRPGADALTHDSEALWQVLSQSGLSLRRVLLVRGQTGREWLAQRLTQNGAVVDRYAAYTRQAADWPDSARRMLSHWRAIGQVPVWLVTSGEGLDAVYRNIVRADMLSWWRKHRFVLTHPRLADRLTVLMGGDDRRAMGQTTGQAMVKISLPQDKEIEHALLSLCVDSSDDVSRLQSSYD